ncbi:hypothetical protein CNR22_24330 [Sphingobacteriaceae bacterium]|nr:hypothetical protein CNR22_00080 [Sphingobacteriaceae bacterium]PBQ34769.1 hypothetical protein CNR22_24330 [Sphingobacteriaceae bacterium]
MIVPGSQLGDIRIGNHLSDYPNAVFIKDLSLNQKQYKLNELFFRIDGDSVVVLISLDVASDESYSEIIKIGSTFEEVIRQFTLYYDDVDLIFHVENIKGLYFTFNHLPISELSMKNVITMICVYNEEMDKNNDQLGLERISLQNFTKFFVHN